MSDPLTAFKETGELKYCAQLYEAYSHMIATLCFKYLGEHAAQDAAAEIFEIMVRDLPTVEVKNFSNWLYTVTKNHCLKTLRKSRSGPQFTSFSEKSEETFMESDPSMDLYDTNGQPDQLEVELENQLKMLPDHQRECVELFYLKGMSYKEIEATTAYTMNEVKSHIQNGKRRLKIALQAAIEDE